jgi:phosphate transport system ATP-binding protein
MEKPHRIRAERSGCCIPVTKLETCRLSVSYGSRTVLHDISLPIHKCCVTAIIRPSECGKSSFLMALNRLLDLVPGAHVTGEILLDGDNVLQHEVDVTVLRRRVGMIFQKPNPFPLSIERNLTLALEHHGVSDRTLQTAIVERSLRAVGLWHEVKDKLHSSGLTLSGGQQQRLCIARAIALQPEVLLMDEPCSALDPRASAQIELLIRELAQQFTVVIVTHNLQQAQRVSDYAALLWNTDGYGRLIEAGSTEVLFRDPQQAETREYVHGVVG